MLGFDWRSWSGKGTGPTALLMATLFGWVALAGQAPDARADADTRTLTFFHTHTKETATVTFWRDGRYDGEGIDRLNWLLRDWRVNEPAKMDPLLFTALWEVYREAGSRAPINIISAYRSPRTNAMLRGRSKGVSEHSQHMLGKAMDIRLPDVDTARLRAIAMRMQYGGVGFYPSSDFVHVDTGNVRAWPRMSQDQLARLFPDGKTVHLPPSGKPLARYEEAKAEIQARNRALASAVSTTPLPSLLASLLKGGSKPAAGVEPPQSAVTASLPPRQDLAVTADTLVPLPPRRPWTEPPRLAVARSDVEAPDRWSPSGARPASSFPTEASMLLFSAAHVSEQRPRDWDAASSAVTTLLPYDYLTPARAPLGSHRLASDLTEGSVEQRFTRSAFNLRPLRTAHADP